MKIILAFFIILDVNLYSQPVTLYFSLNMNEYNKVAKKELQEKYEKKEIFFEYPFSREKYKIDELKLLSIPVFWLNDNAKEYKCGDNFEYIINFKNDFNFQSVLLYNEFERKVGRIVVTYPENEIKRISDSLGFSYLPSNHGGNDYVAEHLLDYVEDNPDVFIFAVNDLYGLWAIKDNRLIALTETCYIHFVGLCKISEYPASEYLSQTFGEEFIRDLAVPSGMRFGYRYEVCKEVDEESFREVIIIADIKSNN